MAQCIHCNQEDSTFCFETKDQFETEYSIYQCNNCSCHFLYPHPTLEQLSKAYENDYYGLGEEKFKTGLIEKILEFFRKRRATYLSKLIAKKGRVLDIGCGNGALLSHLGERGDFELHGLELTEDSAKRVSAKKEVNVKLGPLLKTDYPEKSFDLITSCHVFEHVPNPKEHLAIISKLIKTDGVVFFAFPNIDSWQAKAFKGNWLHLDPPRHLHFFTPKDFVKLMQDNGFELIKSSYSHFEYNPFGWVQSILNGWLNKREVLYEALKGNERYVKTYSSEKSIFLQKLFLAFTLPFFTVLDWIEGALKKGATVELVFKKKL